MPSAAWHCVGESAVQSQGALPSHIGQWFSGKGLLPGLALCLCISCQVELLFCTHWP